MMDKDLAEAYFLGDVMHTWHKRLDDWVSKQYKEQGLGREDWNGEIEAGYEDWVTIYVIIGVAFDKRLITKLRQHSIDTLLFFISCNDELRAIIDSNNGPDNTQLSSIGDLTVDDFIYLCKAALAHNYRMCDFQLVRAISKLRRIHEENANLMEETEWLLRRFFEKEHPYTRWCALSALESAGANDLVELLQNLWRSVEDAHDKLACLDKLKQLGETALFHRNLEEFRREFPITQGDLLSKELDRLIEGI